MYEFELKKMIKDLKLNKQINLKGTTQTPLETLSKYDFCVFPSYFEGFPIGLLESQSVGLPTIGLQECSGVNQLVVNKDNARRREIAKYYRENIKNPKIILPQCKNEESHVWHVFAIRTQNRDELQEYLKQNDIQTLIHYPIPPHKQECYKEWNDRSYPITEEIHKTILSLPISPVMTDEEIEKIVEVINKF